jgi:hypothetical protein
MATNTDMLLQPGSQPMAGNNDTPWANYHTDTGPIVHASTTKLLLNATQKRVLEKFKKWMDLDNTSSTIDKIKFAYEYVSYLRTVNEPLFWGAPHEDSEQFINFFNPAGNLQGNANQIKLARNNESLLVICDLLDSAFDGNPLLIAAMGSASTPRTKLLAMLDSLGLSPKTIIGLAQKWMVTSGQRSVDDHDDKVNVPGWVTHVTRFHDLIRFFGYQTDPEDASLYTDDIDPWNRTIGSMKFSTIFTPYLADLREATAIDDLIRKIKKLMITLQSQAETTDLDLASLTSTGVYGASGSGFKGGSGGKDSKSDDCHACGKPGCRSFYPSCAKYEATQAAKAAKRNAGNGKRNTDTRKRKGDWKANRKSKKVHFEESDYDHGAKQRKKTAKCNFGTKCKYVLSGKCRYDHGTAADWAKAPAKDGTSE